MKKLLMIDRDGTLIKEPADEQIDSFEKLEFVEGAIGALSFISKHTDYELMAPPLSRKTPSGRCIISSLRRLKAKE